MKLEIGFIFKEKDKAISMLNDYLERIKEIKDFKFIKYNQNKIQTLNGYEDIPCIKNIVFNNIDIDKNILRSNYDEKIKDTKKSFFKRFSSFEEFEELCKYYYLPIVVTPEGKIEYTKSYYSKKWITGFKDNLKKYEDYYLMDLTITVQLPKKIHITRGFSIAETEPLIKAMTTGHNLISTVHSDLNETQKEENKDFTLTFHAQNIEKTLETITDLYVKKLKTSPEDIPLLDKFERSLSWGLSNIRKSRDLILKGIDENIIAMVHHENSAWQYVNRYYFITESGKVYKFNNEFDKVDFKDDTNNYINEAVKDIEAELIRTIKSNNLATIKEYISKVIYDKEEKGKVIGAGFDCGNTNISVINEKIRNKPITVRLRGNIMVDSTYEYNNKVADLIKEIINY